MNNNIVETADGSFTLKNNIFNESYHSVNGAISESVHVFINTGFNFCNKNKIRIFEVGFGSGLNAILTLLEAEKQNKKVDYVAIEKYPINIEIINTLNYKTLLNSEYFDSLHNCSWNSTYKITPYFSFLKIQDDLTRFEFKTKFDLIYFDAFSFETQPEMWSLEVFNKIINSLDDNGALVTYSSKGIVKQNLRKAGFVVKRLPGYKKRHILRAMKHTDN